VTFGGGNMEGNLNWNLFGFWWRTLCVCVRARINSSMITILML